MMCRRYCKEVHLLWTVDYVAETLSNHEHIMQPSEDESHNHDDADDRRCLLLLFPYSYCMLALERKSIGNSKEMNKEKSIILAKGT